MTAKGIHRDCERKNATNEDKMSIGLMNFLFLTFISADAELAGMSLRLEVSL